MKNDVSWNKEGLIINIIDFETFITSRITKKDRLSCSRVQFMSILYDGSDITKASKES